MPVGEETRIDSLRSFWREIRGFHKLWRQKYKPGKEWIPWFRGEPNGSLPSRLKPTLYRPRRQKKRDLLHAEQELRLEFHRRGTQLISGRQPADKWEWYFLMAHHRVPTRLLDWTDGALVALHFAVTSAQESESQNQGEPTVYMIDPWWLNSQVFKRMPVRKKDRSEGAALSDWEEAAPYLPDELENEEVGPDLPLAIDPSHVSLRVAAQRSRFVIFGRDPSALQVMLKGERCQAVSDPR